jgi:hypothetical protein
MLAVTNAAIVRKSDAASEAAELQSEGGQRASHATVIESR